MSRTRLDQIVLEEMGEKSGPAITFDIICTRIAERSFRHGVEQVRTAVREGWINTDFQPAPAVDAVREMSERLMQTARSYADGTNPDLQPAPAGGAKPECRCTWRWQSVCPVHPDRRKVGERRKDANWPTNYVHEVGVNAEGRPIYQHSPYGAWYYDRRSGRDRRKG